MWLPELQAARDMEREEEKQDAFNRFVDKRYVYYVEVVSRKLASGDAEILALMDKEEEAQSACEGDDFVFDIEKAIVSIAEDMAVLEAMAIERSQVY